MNKQPVYYMQTDQRWKSVPYRVKGESSTIGSAGCGPTCTAMLISTLTGKTVTPVDTCAWSIANGYKAKNQGTYYSYFKPQFSAYGIDCKQLNTSSTYGNPKSTTHDKALSLLQQGYYLIALMGKGLWTSSGHFIVVWWQGGKLHINDPASKKDSRIIADIDTFRSQVKYYWQIDARKYNNGDDEELTQEQFNKMADKYFENKKTIAPGSWSKESREWAEKTGLITSDANGNSMYKSFITREEVSVVLHRFFKLLKGE